MARGSESDETYDEIYKIILVGDSGVGKTNLYGKYSHYLHTCWASY